VTAPAGIQWVSARLRLTAANAATVNAIAGFVVLSRARLDLRWRKDADKPEQAGGPLREPGPGGRAVLDGRRTRMTDSLEQRVVKLYGRGRSTRSVATELGIAKTTVLRVLKSRGVRPRRR
jgi:DNA invertase Pin-like site-specific DNA recombinase